MVQQVKKKINKYSTDKFLKNCFYFEISRKTSIEIHLESFQ